MKRALKVVAGGLAGFLVAAVAGYVDALVFAESLLGWHDTIGPEVGFSLSVALAGGAIGAILVAVRTTRAGGEPVP